MHVARIAEHYFQRLLHERDSLKAVRELADAWSARTSATGPWLGMSRPEHQVTMVLIYVGEVGNGGHTQFFSNRGGHIVARVRGALHEIGLAELGAVLQDAIAVSSTGELPADRVAVDRLLEELTEEREAVLGRLDGRVWRLDTYPRLIGYVREHEGDLLRPERGLADLR